MIETLYHKVQYTDGQRVLLVERGFRGFFRGNAWLAFVKFKSSAFFLQTQ